MFTEQGFVLVKGLLSAPVIQAASAELRALTTDDRPRCDMIWFEGGLRDHLQLDVGFEVTERGSIKFLQPEPD